MLLSTAARAAPALSRGGARIRALQAPLAGLATAAASSAGPAVIDAHATHVMPTYGRFDLVLSHGDGSYVYDVDGKRYLDLAGGIAVNCLGHAHPALAGAVAAQATRLIHCSNLYYTEQQGRLAERLSHHMAASTGGATGKTFFCNSGAEANEGMFKLARRYGDEHGGRYGVITALDSFHGRTLGGIGATGQEKIKDGFGPAATGDMFKHVPFNDVEAAAAAVDENTVAILVEGIQGESGVVPATASYLRGLRALCDEHDLLLLVDAVQCGHFRSGRFQSFERIFELDGAGDSLAPDAVSMAKSLGGGVPIGGVWARGAHAELLSAGKHGTTYGGNPLACAAANAVLDTIEREALDANVRARGSQLVGGLLAMQGDMPGVIKEVRGLGLMLGVEVHSGVGSLEADGAPPPAVALCNMLHELGVLSVGAGTHTVRLLPPFTLSEGEADEALDAFRRVFSSL